MTLSTSGAAPPLIEIQRASFGYGRGAPILRDVDLAVARGEFLGVIGPNGSGKSTLLRAVLGILEPLAGAVRRAQGERTGYVPQRQALDPIWPVRAIDIVLMGLAGEIGLLRRPHAEHRRRAEAALASSGMQAHAGRLFRDLSGGQQQRVLIARALVSEPDLIVLDEPTNHLDLAGEHDVMGLVEELHRGGRTIVLVSHDLHIISAHAGRMALVYDGGVKVGAVSEMLTPERLRPVFNTPIRVVDVEGRRIVLPIEGPAS